MADINIQKFAVILVISIIGTFYLMSSNLSKTNQRVSSSSSYIESKVVELLNRFDKISRLKNATKERASYPYASVLNLVSKFDKLNGLAKYLKNNVDTEEKDILFRTLSFMLEERDANDKELIEFAKGLIHQPLPDSQLSLTEKNKSDFSQFGQSKYIDGLLASRTNGFFVEAGGWDGELYSNSLFFELERNWTGILIEPQFNQFKKLISKNRRIYAINACITDKVSVAKFTSFKASLLSGIEEAMSEYHKSRGDTGHTTIFVPCFSLETILRALDVKKVDYFSLDVEGGESYVLKAIDFSKTDIETLSIEHDTERLDSIREIMKLNSLYNETKKDISDIYYAKLH